MQKDIPIKIFILLFLIISCLFFACNTSVTKLSPSYRMGKVPESCAIIPLNQIDIQCNVKIGHVFGDGDSIEMIRNDFYTKLSESVRDFGIFKTTFIDTSKQKFKRQFIDLRTIHDTVQISTPIHGTKIVFKSGNADMILFLENTRLSFISIPTYNASNYMEFTILSNFCLFDNRTGEVVLYGFINTFIPKPSLNEQKLKEDWKKVINEAAFSIIQKAPF